MAVDIIARGMAGKSLGQNKIQDQQIKDIQTRLMGVGGFLNAHDFGTTTPFQQALTDYAMSELPELTGPSQIYNGTKVLNSYDNHLWILNNEPENGIFVWVDLGENFASGYATEQYPGYVRSSVQELKVHVDDEGIMTVNGLEEAVAVTRL